MIRRWLLALGCLLVQSACAQESPTDARVAPVPSVVATPAVTLPQVEMALREATRVTSFILFQHGNIASEHYDAGHSRTQAVNIKSASKSILNALTAIALDRGDVRSLDTPISEYLPQYFRSIPSDDSRRRITIRHLLTMSSGLPSTSIYNYGAWVSSRDWIAYALDQTPISAPGERMTYSTGDTHLLAAVLTKATGTPLRTYAQRHLFDPLGVRIADWDRDPQGNYFGGNNFALSPEGVLRFGQLYLDEGVFKGQRVLNAEWVRESWTPRFLNSSYNGRHDYGYLWWHGTYGGASTWFAWGYGGQFLFVVPELDAVVVITGDPDAPSRGGNNEIYDLMDSTIVPYLRSAHAARAASIE